MKRFWIAVGIIMLLASAAMVNVWYLGCFTETLSKTLEQAQQLAEDGDAEQAAALTLQAQDAFNQKSFYLHVTLSHRDIDDIETSFGEVLEYLRLGDTGSKYTSANAKLLTQLCLLAEAEQLTLKNIL